jgi:hypothetical protein
VLFEGSPRAVDTQLAAARALVGGAETGPEVWEQARSRQSAARGRVRFPPGDLARVLADVPEAVVRAAAGVAYTRDTEPSDTLSLGETAATLRNLLERIRHEFDPNGVLT